MNPLRQLRTFVRACNATSSPTQTSLALMSILVTAYQHENLVTDFNVEVYDLYSNR